MALPATRPPSGNLPAPTNTFVGRRRQLDEVRGLLSSARLVTLAGVGGVGKTRLAIRVAADVRRAFPDGVWLVDLAPLDDPALVTQTAATAIGIRDQSARWPVAVLSDHLAAKHLLLILDNCEHLLDAFAALCARLDGVPLAIELAVARLRALSPEQVLDRLDERFGLLTRGSRTALPRQQTLRALVDWSYALCSPEERALWERLSVFAGSFDLQAAENVCADGALPRSAVLDLVAGLVEKSVLLREEHRSGVRYRLLETIRQYGRDRLVEHGDDIRLRGRHRAQYLALAERANAGLFSQDGPAWLDRLRVEHPNVRAALDFCLPGSAGSGSAGSGSAGSGSAGSGSAGADTGLRLAAVLWFGWRGMGLLSEGRRWLDRLLAVGTEPTVSRARALWVNGSLAVLQGDVPAARPMLAESASLAERLGDTSAQAYAAVFLGQVAMAEGDTAAAAELLERGLAGHRAADDPFGAALALVRLSLTASARGDAEQASRFAVDYIALCEAKGAGWLAAFGHFALAVELWRRGDQVGAVAEARSAV